MSRTVLVIAPHPDDETLGCGGTLLRHIAEGDNVYWLIVTQMHLDYGYTEEQIVRRKKEIDDIANSYGFSDLVQLSFSAAHLDRVPLAELVQAIGQVIQQLIPDILYIPYRNDAHSDHACVFDAVSACSKSFRYPSIREVYAYETLSETGFALTVDNEVFNPNSWVDISNYLEKKITIMAGYNGEMGHFPFPRSAIAIRALAQLRGTQCYSMAAEAFMLLKSVR